MPSCIIGKVSKFILTRTHSFELYVETQSIAFLPHRTYIRSLINNIAPLISSRTCLAAGDGSAGTICPVQKSCDSLSPALYRRGASGETRVALFGNWQLLWEVFISTSRLRHVIANWNLCSETLSIAWWLWSSNVMEFLHARPDLKLASVVLKRDGVSTFMYVHTPWFETAKENYLNFEHWFKA